MATDELKEQIYQEVVDLMKGSELPYGSNVVGLCLYWTLCGCIALNEHGFKPCIQAGTANWPMIELDTDDGKQITHFGYNWEPDHILSKMAKKMNMLPEYHSWIGLPATQEGIDFSVGTLPEQAKHLGFNWTAPRPPNFYWVSGSWPRGVLYKPEKAAVEMVMHIIKYSGFPEIRQVMLYARKKYGRMDRSRQGA